MLRNQVSRQDLGSEEGRDAKRSYSFKACIAKMDWPVTRMSDEWLPTKVFYGELQ